MTVDDEREAFLLKIREDPGDDTVRLVYADWLEERGDRWWPRLIRLQVQKAEEDQDADSWDVAGAAAHEMGLHTIGKIGQFAFGARKVRIGNPGGGVVVHFERGFPHTVEYENFTATGFHRKYSKVLFRYPVERVTTPLVPVPNVAAPQSTFTGLTWDWWLSSSPLDSDIGRAPALLFRALVAYAEELPTEVCYINKDVTRSHLQFVEFDTRARALKALSATLLRMGREAYRTGAKKKEKESK